MNIAVVTIAIVVAGMRMGGMTHESYQAAAHLYVGGLIGAWLVGRTATDFGTESQARVNVYTAIALTVVEVGAFLWFRFA